MDSPASPTSDLSPPAGRETPPAGFGGTHPLDLKCVDLVLEQARHHGARAGTHCRSMVRFAVGWQTAILGAILGWVVMFGNMYASSPPSEGQSVEAWVWTNPIMRPATIAFIGAALVVNVFYFNVYARAGAQLVADSRTRANCIRKVRDWLHSAGRLSTADVQWLQGTMQPDAQPPERIWSPGWLQTVGLAQWLAAAASLVLYWWAMQNYASSGAPTPGLMRVLLGGIFLVAMVGTLYGSANLLRSVTPGVLASLRERIWPKLRGIVDGALEHEDKDEKADEPSTTP